MNQSSDLEHFENITLRARDAEFRTCLRSFAETVGHDTDAGTIDMRHSRQIHDHHLAACFEDPGEFGFDIAALSTERDASADFNHRDAVFQLPISDLENHARCTQDTASDGDYQRVNLQIRGASLPKHTHETGEWF